MKIVDMVGPPIAVQLTSGQAALAAAGIGQMAVTGHAGGNTITSITGGVSGAWLAIKFVDALVNITAAAAKFKTDEVFYGKAGDILLLFYDGTDWNEVSRCRKSHAPTALTLAAAETALAVATVPTIDNVKAVALTGDAGGNAITSITGLKSGQLLLVRFIDALVNFTTAAAKFDNNLAYFPQAGDVALFFHDGTNIREISRTPASRAATSLVVLGAGATTINVTNVPVINGIKTVKVAGDGGGNNITTITGFGSDVILRIIGITAAFTLKAALGKMPGGADVAVTVDDVVQLHYDGTTIRCVSVSTNA